MDRYSTFNAFLLRQNIARCLKIMKDTITQGRRNGFQSRGAIEHWKVFPIVTVDRQEKNLNSIGSRMTKTVTLWRWWQTFNSFCFETISFFSLFPFFYLFVLLRKNVEGTMTMGPHPPVVAGLATVSLVSLTWWARSIHATGMTTFASSNNFLIDSSTTSEVLFSLFLIFFTLR